MPDVLTAYQLNRMTLTIDGVDYAAMFDKYSYSVSYEVREGSNSGTMKDGTRVADILARKVIINLATNVGIDLANLIAALKKDYVTVEYSTPEGDTATGLFTPELGTFSVAMYKGGTIVWDNGANVTLTEV